jgi:hypothetical protein
MHTNNVRLGKWLPAVYRRRPSADPFGSVPGRPDRDHWEPGTQVRRNTRTTSMRDRKPMETLGLEQQFTRALLIPGWR